MNHRESHTRSIVKGISWRIVGTIDTIIIAFLVTGQTLVALSIGGIEVVSKVVLYYLHERIWQNMPANFRQCLKIFLQKYKTNESNVIPKKDWYINRQMREQQLKQKGVVLWLTGLSGAGKTTIANEFEKKTFELGCKCQVLDGDSLRSSINSDLGFSEDDRNENIRRIAEIAKLYAQSGFITVVSVISPLQSMRDIARDIIGKEDFVEVFVKASLEICEVRDPKGLYAKARAGKLRGFTGIDGTYEVPQQPDLVLDTELENVEACVRAMVGLVKD